MYFIGVLNRQKAKAYSLNTKKQIKTAIISICDIDKEYNKIKITNDNVCKTLFLRFEDTADPDSDFAITTKDADKIAKFVKNLDKDIEQIIVQCEAGVSRSAGVAAAILKHYSGDDSQIYDNPKYIPNNLCYRKVLEALYYFGDDYSIEDSLKFNNMKFSSLQ